MTPLQTGYRPRFGFRLSLGEFLAVLISAALVLGTSLQIGIGAPRLLNDPALAAQGKTQVRGYLANRQEYHYLGLQVSARFTTVQLSMTVEPLGISQDTDAGTINDSGDEVHTVELSPADTVNFLVLTELGLQRFLAGDDPWAVNLAAGTLNPAADGSLRFEAEFRSIGRGGYTVLVYNSSDTPATYRLEVNGGNLIDGAGQTVPASHLQLNPLGQLETVATSPTVQAAPTLATLPVAALGRPSPLPTRADSLGGQLHGSTQRHYFVLEPAADADEISISLAYTVPQLDPAQSGSLHTIQGGINYWLFTEAGVRQLDQGAPAEFLSLASGMPFLGVPNLLRTRVRLTGETAYVLVVYNQTGQDIDYRARVTGGALVDLYQQSREANMAPDSPAASGDTLTLIVPEADTPRVLPKALEVIPAPEADANSRNETGEVAPPVDGAPLDAPQDENSPTQPRYRLPLFHVDHFENLAESLRLAATPQIDATEIAAADAAQWTVAPDGAFARVVITLEAQDSDLLAGTAQSAALQDVRIWVVSTEGLRRVHAGMDPSQATVTGFTVLRLGQDQGILQASFDAVGYEPYTVIVENGSGTPLTFQLNVRNGLFHLPSAHANSGLH